MAAEGASAWLKEKLQAAMGSEKGLVEPAIKKASAQIQAFFGKDGPQKLIFFHQVEELEVNPGEFQASKSAQKGLFLTDGEHQRARGRSIYFVRPNVSKPIDMAKIDSEVVYGEILPGILDRFADVLAQVLTPSVSAQEWSKCAGEEQQEFRSQLEHFNHTLTEAAGSLQGGVELRKPDADKVEAFAGPEMAERAKARDGRAHV